jgi:hypothetical protein
MGRFKKAELFLAGPDPLSERMMQHTGTSDNAELCKQGLAYIALMCHENHVAVSR